MRRRLTLTEGYVFFLLCTVSGASFLALKFSVEELPPLFLSAIRAGLAGILVLGFITLIENKKIRLADLKKAFFISILRRSIPFACFSYAVIPLTSGLLSVFVSTAPIWAFVWQFFRTKKAPAIRQVFGLLVGILCIGIIALPNASNEATVVPVLVALLGAASAVAGSMLTHEDAGKPFHLLGLELIIGGLILWAASYLHGEVVPEYGELTNKALLGVCFLVIFHGFFGQIGQIWIMTIAGASEGMLFIYVSPLIALALGFLAGGEHFSTSDIIASLLLLASVYIVRFNPKSRRRKKKVLKTKPAE
ncbi:MAG: EamA family transporter [Bdellovibrionales bacterium]|nr:EamA family transporter [Bdellovibrionales bacterium]